MALEALKRNGHNLELGLFSLDGPFGIPRLVPAHLNDRIPWMREIDEMDMLGFLRIRSWKARQDQARQEPVPRFIDEVWPNLKP